MYVRSYGASPRENGHDHGVSSASPQESESTPQENTTEPIEQGISQPNTEKTEASVFGSNGMPRQPLKRRKRKTKPPTCGKSPQTPPIPDQSDNIPREPIAPILAPCETVHNHDSGCEKPHECIDPPPHRCEVSKPKNPLGCLSTEELFLGGLIILLINEGANDDILLILAFLLISGIRFEQ